MKKNELTDAGYWEKSIGKLLLIMKITLLLAVINILGVYATGYSQSTKLSLDLRNAKLKEVFTQIESQTSLSFLYKSDVVNTEELVSIKANDVSVKEVLNKLLANKKVQFEILDNSLIVLMPSDGKQQNKISGNVTDASTGEAIIGANVLVEGTTIGTVTDIDGNFSLDVPRPDAAILVSFLGYNTERLVMAGQTEFTVKLIPDIKKLEEVVVVGYGTVKKKDLTGAVGSVQGESIAERKSAQISQALQGAIPGVMITRDNNAPGSTATIQIRGVTTIGETSPLIIVDGIPVNDINSINPNDVENVSVLKDAASASIYGSRAAAGVILITTKRAKSNQLSLDYDFEYGIEKPTRMSEYVDAVRYMQMVNELRWNDNNNGTEQYPTYAKDVVDNYGTLNKENPNKYPITDWTDLILKDNAPRQTHRLSLTAGTNVIRSRATISYDEIGGLYTGRNYKRFTARFNNDININKYLSAAVDFYAKRSISENPSMDPIYTMRISAPVYAAKWSNGLIAEGKSGANIYGQLEEGGYKKYWYNQMGGKISLDFAPLDGLKISAVVSPEFNYNKGKEFLEKVSYTDYDDPSVYIATLQWATTTRLNESRDENYHVTTQFIANYNKSIGNNNFNLMIGNENFSAHYEELDANSDQLELTSYPYLDLGNTNYLTNGGLAYENAYRSFFGRIMYNYRSKYYLQGNIRYDGSSRFDKDYRWGAFPSFSAGWVISEESFMKDIPVLSFLKLRASWGSLGNERIGNYPYQSTIAFGSALFYRGNEIVSSTTAAQTKYAIRDISWETTQSYDFGADISFFDNKLHFTGDYYKKLTRDMLLELEIPDYFGYDNPDQNTGKMHTTGWEFEIGWKDKIGQFNYSISANLSDSKSKMGDLGGIQFLGDQVKFQGSEFNEWYGYVSDGIYQKEEDVKGTATTSSSIKAGDIRYKDISGPNGTPDGLISSTYDRVLLGGSLPRYLYGGNIHLGYKNLDFSMTFQGVGKQNVRYTNMMVMPLLENWGSIPKIIDGNYWSKYNSEEQNRGAKYPRLSYTTQGNNYAMSDFWMFNGAYFRLKNITLGYNLPKSILEKIRIQNLRIYGSVSDILSIDKYPKGWDPEVSGTAYPITTSFILGASVKF
ncbi:MAG TPA: TonB-dependent receptor [Bacteroidales bacterium]|nr:TonB-dependent receptor [Bacteroidales bacterium]